MRLRQLAIALDQLANALLGGYADETLSAKAHRMDGRKRRWTFARRAIDLIFFFDPHHCATSYTAEFARRHLPPEYRAQQRPSLSR